jgi:hypothetical protein
VAECVKGVAVRHGLLGEAWGPAVYIGDHSDRGQVFRDCAGEAGHTKFYSYVFSRGDPLPANPAWCFVQEFVDPTTIDPELQRELDDFVSRSRRAHCEAEARKRRK